jgi:hypothetical protein
LAGDASGWHKTKSLGSNILLFLSPRLPVPVISNAPTFPQTLPSLAQTLDTSYSKYQFFLFWTTEKKIVESYYITYKEWLPQVIVCE